MNILLTMLLMVSNVFAQNNNAYNYEEYVKKSAAYNASYARIMKDLVIFTAEARKNDLTCEPGTYTGDITKNAVSALTSALYADYEGKTVYNEIKAVFESNPAVMDTIGKRFSYRITLAQFDDQQQSDWNKITKKAMVGSQFYTTGDGAEGTTRKITILSETKVLIEDAQYLNVEPWIKWNKKEVALKITAVNYDLLYNFNGETYKMRWSSYDNTTILVPTSVPDEKVNEVFEGVYFENESAECEG